HKLANGLPACNMGRIGLDWYRKDPKVVFAILESEKIGMGLPPGQAGAPAEGAYLGVQGQDAEAGAKLTAITSGGPADKAGLKSGDIILMFDNKPVLSYNQMVEQLRGRKIGDKVMVRGARNRQAFELAVTLEKRPPEQPSRAPASKRPYTFWYGGQ